MQPISIWPCACMLAATVLLTAKFSDSLTTGPMLFMDLQDVDKVEGRVRAVANPTSQLSQYSTPPENYTAGATVFAAFPVWQNKTELHTSEGVFEVFVAVGRPGEPWFDSSYREVRPGSDTNERALSEDGVQVKRYTTSDFKKYSEPVVVLFLPDGDTNDGKIWTVKSMDRNPKSGEYMLLASYGSTAHSFSSGHGTPPTAANSLKPTTGNLSVGNIKDHDDTNIIYSLYAESNEPWVDMQIMYEDISVTMAKTYPKKKYCDNISNTTRRVVSYRTSADGVTWTQDAGCADKPQKDEHCHSFNIDGMIRPDPKNDPPELEFYRIRPFYFGDSQRLLAHALLYTPAPPEVVVVPGYGRQPLWYCKSGCCHGPHMYEEWWVGPNDGNPTNLSQWRRPFYDVHAFPHDIWAMSQPVVYNDSHIWVDNGAVWGLPLYRLAGLYTESNGEVITSAFKMPSEPLWINAHALWEGDDHTGGCDEGCAAYIMIELIDAESGAIIPGYEKEKCIMVNVDGLRLPVVWKKKAADFGVEDADDLTGTELAGKEIKMKIYFRDATIYAIGHQ